MDLIKSMLHILSNFFIAWPEEMQEYKKRHRETSWY
jgi:hypothetical protein